MKKLVLLGACLLALAYVPAVAQTTQSQVVIVTLSYTGAMLGTGHLLVNRNGTVEDLPLPGAASPKSPTERSEALRKVVAQLTQEGYVLKGTLNSVDLIFVKEK